MGSQSHLGVQTIVLRLFRHLFASLCPWIWDWLFEAMACSKLRRCRYFSFWQLMVREDFVESRGCQACLPQTGGQYIVCLETEIQVYTCAQYMFILTYTVLYHYCCYAAMTTTTTHDKHHSPAYYCCYIDFFLTTMVFNNCYHFC